MVTKVTRSPRSGEWRDQLGIQKCVFFLITQKMRWSMGKNHGLIWIIHLVLLMFMWFDDGWMMMDGGYFHGLFIEKHTVQCHQIRGKSSNCWWIFQKPHGFLVQMATTWGIQPIVWTNPCPFLIIWLVKRLLWFLNHDMYHVQSVLWLVAENRNFWLRRMSGDFFLWFSKHGFLYIVNPLDHLLPWKLLYPVTPIMVYRAFSGKQTWL